MKNNNTDLKKDFYEALNKLKDPMVWLRGFYYAFLDPKMWVRGLALYGLFGWMILSTCSVIFVPFAMVAIDHTMISIHKGSDLVTILNPSTMQINQNMTSYHLSKPSQIDYLGTQGSMPIIFGITLDDIFWNWVKVSPFSYIAITIYILLFTRFDTNKIRDIYREYKNIFKGNPKVEPSG